MKQSVIILLTGLLVVGCSTKNEEAANGAAQQPMQSQSQQPEAQQPGMQQQGMQQPGVNTPPPASQDVSTEGLAKIDPDVRKYDDEVTAAKKAYDAKKDAKTKSALVEAYVRFGDYMTYDSPVSPRQGKYHRALIEYRHALTLDPRNEKVQREIAQIEDIYRSMGRPIPAAEL